MKADRRQELMIVAAVGVLIAVALTLILLASHGVFSRGAHPCPAFGC